MGPVCEINHSPLSSEEIKLYFHSLVRLYDEMQN
jgi:hypothetical protein